MSGFGGECIKAWPFASERTTLESFQLQCSYRTGGSFLGNCMAVQLLDQLDLASYSPTHGDSENNPIKLLSAK